MKPIIDTHTHTKASDGTFTPAQMVQYAKSQGLEVIAKTDHDTVFGNDEAVVTGNKLGIKVIPGIEIDAIYVDPNTQTKVKGIELLGLGIDSHKMQPFCDTLSQIRISTVQAAVNLYNQYIQSSEFESQNAHMQFPIATPKPISIMTLLDTITIRWILRILHHLFQKQRLCITLWKIKQ